MRSRISRVCSLSTWAATALCLTSLTFADEPRLAPGDDDDPYRVGTTSSRLITPQWIGEPGVEAVVILSIDDLTDNLGRYETFLAPILQRLERIDGRAAVNVLSCRIDRNAPGLDALIRRGVGFDVHTLTHPCPLLSGGELGPAASTVHDCLDLVSRIPGQTPVAFRMPCCDSQNTVSPRFYAEIFNRNSAAGRFLRADSSVFTILTPDDPALPREVVFEPDGRERFRKYLPVGRSFVNLVENHPYPYTIRRLAWEFPCIVPSDWEAQNAHRPNNPKTVEDLRAAIDGVVAKQGVFTFVFHPHGWITSEMVVELIDHAVARYGKKVAFLTFREAVERLDGGLLAGNSLRDARGRDGGSRVVDLDRDGFSDVLIGNPSRGLTRLWNPRERVWREFAFPHRFVDDRGSDAGVRLGRVIDASGRPTTFAFVADRTRRAASLLRPEGWVEVAAPAEVETLVEGRDAGTRFVDLDGDGCDELVAAGLGPSRVLRFDADRAAWKALPFGLPSGIALVDEHGGDPGTRFVDVDDDGDLDLISSNETRQALFLFEGLDRGWSREVFDEPDGPTRKIPALTRQGRDLGAWFADRTLWIQNEHTAGKPDLVDRRPFAGWLASVEPAPREPSSAFRSFRVEPGFEIDLVASEPLIRDPVAFDWSADGRLWVVEMGDYPTGSIHPQGRIRVLEDRDGDGFYEHGVTFLEGLSFPTGIAAHRGGVLISCAPEVIYAEDRDGDGRAEVREVLFDGFGVGNPQHRVNGFAWGLDGRFDLANGDSGGTIRSVKSGKIVSISGRDLRIDPDSGDLQPVTGPTQFGRSRDDWGNWFGNDNSTWGRHYVLDEADLARNPGYLPASLRKTMNVPTKVHPISATHERFNMPASANHVTSANSFIAYRDDLFGPAFANAAFVSEPVHNLIRRIDLEAAGPSFEGRLASGFRDREFLASSDNWFRPTSLRVGPDGALWIADMYRAVIEHPEWIPDETEKRIDLRAGADRGRIYRVRPVGAPRRPIPRLDRLDARELAAALDSPNGWTRDTAQRLLMERKTVGVAPVLASGVRLFPRAASRVQAIWTLSNLDALDAETVVHALKDRDPRVRATAATIALRRGDPAPEVVAALLALARDGESVVRFSLARALGNWRDARAGDALAEIARIDPDPWTRSAVLTSARPHAARMLRRLVTTDGLDDVIDGLFVSLTGSEPESVLADLRSELFVAEADGGLAPRRLALAARIAKSPAGEAILGPVAERVALRRAVVAMIGSNRDPASIAAAIRAIDAIGLGVDERREHLVGFLRPTVAVETRHAAIEALGRSNDPKVPAALLAGWSGYSPATRSQVLEILLSREPWTRDLLSSLEDDCTPARDVVGVPRDRLLNHADPAVRGRSVAVFQPTTTPRDAVVDLYRPALSKRGDREHGAELFRKHCANCHRFAGGAGAEVGPDLSTIGDKPVEAVLIALLDPNRAVESRYATYTVSTTDGRVLSGLMSNESAHAITIRAAGGKDETLPRSELESVVGSSRSLMPEGFEKELGIDAVADLLAFLATGATPPKVIEGNRPTRVEPGSDGVIRLRAADAELRGGAITFESTHGNIGYWTGADDRADWTVAIPRPGRYRVRFDYACPGEAAGDRLAIDLGGRRIEWTVAATASWDEYRVETLGEVDLEAGEQRISVRPVGAPRAALIDLRTLELVPSR
ncbi:MAG: HEAT repeat domain-containing protein [Isosphaeraceae bacterium]|nr:HEAT repeat domain-containing protein [Isosphaeraceae bacterium]